MMLIGIPAYLVTLAISFICGAAIGGWVVLKFGEKK